MTVRTKSITRKFCSGVNIIITEINYISKLERY